MHFPIKQMDKQSRGKIILFFAVNLYIEILLDPPILI